MYRDVCVRCDGTYYIHHDAHPHQHTQTTTHARTCRSAPCGACGRSPARSWPTGAGPRRPPIFFFNDYFFYFVSGVGSGGTTIVCRVVTRSWGKSKRRTTTTTRPTDLDARLRGSEGEAVGVEEELALGAVEIGDELLLCCWWFVGVMIGWGGG